MNTSPVLAEMTEEQKLVETTLTKWGFQSIWANGKGGGFWVRGHGYLSLLECAQLINNTIREFIAGERERLNDLMDKAMKEAQNSQNMGYFESSVEVYLDASKQLKELDSLTFPVFRLSFVPFKPFGVKQS